MVVSSYDKVRKEGHGRVLDPPEGCPAHVRFAPRQPFMGPGVKKMIEDWAEDQSFELTLKCFPKTVKWITFPSSLLLVLRFIF
jgi:hypothetical protein